MVHLYSGILCSSWRSSFPEERILTWKYPHIGKIRLPCYTGGKSLPVGDLEVIFPSIHFSIFSNFLQ